MYVCNKIIKKGKTTFIDKTERYTPNLTKILWLAFSKKMCINFVKKDRT